MRINNNLMAMNTHRQLGINAGNGAKSIEKLSSGYRINRAGDDAAGLAISEKMRAQIRGLNQASRNSQDGISMIQTAEGALNESQAILQRMRELAVQSANDTNVAVDRSELQKEVNQLTEELTRISDTTEFNTQKLLDGSVTSVKFQIGANQNQNISLAISNMSASALDVTSESVTIGDKGGAVTSVALNGNFAIEDYTLESTSGGAVAAKAYAVGVDGTDYVEDLTMSYAKGISGNLTFVNDKISVDGTYSGFNWKDVDLASTASVTVSKVSGQLKVVIQAETSGGTTFSGTDQYAMLNSGTGNYEFNSYGISFSMSKADFDAAASGAALKLDFQKFGTSGTNLSGDYATKSTVTYSGLSGTTAPTFGDITFGSGLVAGAAKITISGSNSSGGTSGSFTIKILDASGSVLVNDTFTFSGAISGFTYADHGVSFSFSGLDKSGAAAFSFSGSITTVDNSLTTTATSKNLTLKITDQSGTDVTFNVTLNSGKQDIQDIADSINTAASLNGFTSDVASVSDGKLVLTALSTGTDSVVQVTGSGATALFSGASKIGSDASVNLTLSHATNSGLNITVSGIQASDTSAVFTDADGNTATFTLKDYGSFSGIDTASAYSASDMALETTGIDISSNSSANIAITAINEAIEKVSSERSKLGAVQNRLEHTIKNLDNVAENLQASESRIRDVDMAKEMMEFTKNNILQQAAQAMLAQANQAPQGVLQLLR